LDRGSNFRLFSTRVANQTIFSAGGGDAPISFAGYSFDRTRGTTGGQGPNDTCTNAREITTLPFTETLDTTMATSANDDPLQSCTLGGPARNSNSVWYKFTPSSNGTITADTAGSNYDTILSAHTGSCGSLTEAACDDDSGGGFNSQIRLDVTGGRTYLFMVTGFGAKSAGGTLIFNLSFMPRGQRIIRVAQRGGGDFTSVQTAIDDARQGEIVEIIDSETYRENLRITTNGITVRAAQGRTPVIDGSSREGHAVEIDGATGVTIERLTIRGGNFSGGGGAGVRARNGASVTLGSNVITSNQRGVSVSASQVILQNNRVENNRGTGIIFFTGSSGSIEGNTIQNNNDGDSASPFDRGIEIQNLTQTLEIKNNTISGNASQGVIVFSSNVTLTDNRISGNLVGVLGTVSSSTAAGAVVNVRNNTIENHREEGIALFAQTSGEITGNKILNNNDRNANTFFDRGIEIVNTAGEFLIQNNEITGNGNQGVIIFSTRARLINNLIANNAAGVTLNASSDTPTLGAQANLINNTIAVNSNLGVSTVSGSSSRAIIVNSIISGNTDDLDGVASADVSFTLIGDGTFANQNNNLTGDPRFVSAAGGNFRLQSNSPAIDRGSNAAIAGVMTDLAGNARVVDGDRNGTATVDLGAYEFQ
jgi:parallel beta-helix repeat protein